MSPNVFPTRQLFVRATLLAAALCFPALSWAGPLCDGRDSDGDGGVDEGCARVCEDPQSGGEQALSSAGIDAPPANMAWF